MSNFPMSNYPMSEQTRRQLIRVAKAIVALLIVLSISKAVRSYCDQLDLANLERGWLAMAMLIALGHRLSNACGWSLVLRALRVELPVWTSVRIWITSEACRWLPGSVWSYGSRALQAKQQGVPAVTAGASLLLEMALTIGAWVTTAVIGLSLYYESFGHLWQQLPAISISLPLVGLIAAAAGGVVVVGYLTRNLIRDRLAVKWTAVQDRLEALRQARPRMQECLLAWGFYVVMCMVNGVAAWIVVRAVSGNADVPFMAVVGANAAAWLIGFFAIMAPGGLVVREGALAALLVPWIPLELALAAAVIWRFLQVVVEVVCMAGVYVIHFAVRYRQALLKLN